MRVHLESPVDAVRTAAMLVAVDRSGYGVADGAAVGNRAETRSRIHNPSPQETLPFLSIHQDSLALASRLRLTPASAASTASRR